MAEAAAVPRTRRPSSSLRDLLRFERLVSEISSAFIDLQPKDVDAVIHDSLRRIVAVLGIDRSSLHRISTVTGVLHVTHSYAVEGVSPVPTTLTARDMTPWTFAMAMADRPVVFAHLDDLPPEASIDKKTFRAIELQSHVTMPMVVDGRFHGGLSFGSVRSQRSWSPELLGRMRLLAQVFGSAMARKQAQEQLDRAIDFEHLASTVLVSLVLARPGRTDAAIALGLQQIGHFMASGHVALWRAGAGGEFRITHQWRGDAIPAQSVFSPTNQLPWTLAQIALGRVVRLTGLDDLPQEAQVDAQTLGGRGVRSFLVVPIESGGRFDGALSIASHERENEWPDTLMPSVRLLADVFGNLQAREAAEERKHAAEVEAAHWRERLAHLVRIHTAGEMSVALAHEISQPLSAIEGYALAARRRGAAPSVDMPLVLELLDKVVGQANRAATVVTRMRNMARRHELAIQPVDLARALAETVDMLKADSESRGIGIRLRVDPRTPAVMVDEIHLQQVLLNLLRNAMEAVEQVADAQDRTIEVDIGPGEGDEVQVEVADRGAGIAPGELERVFESFYSTKSSGLGVGLAISRKLIESLGGRLWAAHRTGGGAVFRFTVPVADAAAGVGTQA